jgi:PAS domain S-box-containing protein
MAKRQEDDTRAALAAQLLDGMTALAVVALDPDGRVRFWNAGATQIFGHEASDVLGRGVELIFTEADRAAGIPAQERERALEHGLAADVRWHLRAGGEPVWITGSVVPWRAADGAHLGFIKWGEDQTLRHRTEEALQRQLAVLDEFLGHAAHDLRAPLRTIRNMLQLVEEDYGPALEPDAVDLLVRAGRAATQLDGLVTETLSYVRLGQYRPDRQLIDANLIFDAAVAALQSQLDECGGTVTREALGTVHADSTLLRRLLQNLIGNALAHRGAAPPVVLVGCDKRVGELEMRVEDNGPGIPSELKDRLFEPFRRGDRRGFGLGLAISRRIVEAHGGRIWVEPRPGGGSSFRFTLPSP